MDETKIILVAGGTGLIGKELCNLLQSIGHEVRILSRQKSIPKKGIYHWNPQEKSIDQQVLMGVQIIINLAGENVGEGRWTSKRKDAIISSRVLPVQFLFEQKAALGELEQYISASGVNAYGFKANDIFHTENNPYGEDFLSQVVKQWEESAEVFSDICSVTKLRIGVVFSKNGGALSKIAAPIKFGVGSALGTGNQNMAWISSSDLCQLFVHVIQKQLSGTFNAITGNISNREITHEIAKILHRPIWLPAVPSLFLRIALGEMADIVLQGVKASNQKLKSTGFKFSQESIQAALKANL